LFGKRDGITDGYPVTYKNFHRAVIVCYSTVTMFVIGWFTYAAIRLSGPFAAHIKLSAVLISRDVEHGDITGMMATVVGVLPGLLMLGFALYRLLQTARPLLLKIRRSKD
jgi:hypothetical protein